MDSENNNIENNTNEEPFVPATSASPQNAFGPSGVIVSGPKVLIHEPKVPEEQIKKEKGNGIFDKDELLKIFVGPNYDKLLTKRFNFAAFFLTWIYYFYRKMNAYGIIVLLFTASLGYFLRAMPYFLILVNLLCGLLTNKLYVSFAFSKINKILLNNAGMVPSYVRDVCRDSGGRSIKNVITSILKIVLITVPVVAIIIFLNSSFNLKEYFSNLDFNNFKLPEFKAPSLTVDDKFDGYIIIDKSKDINSEFDIKVPSVFKTTRNNKIYDIEYEYISGDKQKSTCTFNLKAIKGYKNSKNLIKDMIEFYEAKDPSKFKEDIVNGIFWNSFNYSTGDENVYYYACNKGDTVYLLIYIDEMNTNTICHNYAGFLVNEIKLKTEP